MDTRWKSLTRELDVEAHRALGTPSFHQRNELHARAVAKQTGELARSDGLDGKFAPAFLSAALEAGALFAPAFTVNGTKRDEREREYKQAVNGAGAVAFGTLVALRPEAGEVVGRARLEDLQRLVARWLGISSELSETELIDCLEHVVPHDDFFFSELAKLPRQAAGASALGEPELKTLSLGLRLAHATWKAGQVHRAAWEGDDKRIDSSQQVPFLPYDAALRRRYDEVMAERGASKFALCAVVFEVYKDLLELNMARTRTRSVDQLPTNSGEPPNSHRR